MRHYRWYDHLLSGLQSSLQTLSGTKGAARANPAQSIPASTLSPIEQRYSAALMRINHTGEVCAQALYLGQSLTTTDPQLRQIFADAAQEEQDHLAWCQTRLKELNSHTSYLNPLWFTGSLLIGTCAGLFGNGWNLGFLAQTEQQVYAHLESHLQKLPGPDEKSRAIVRQMQQDEAEHASTAIAYGAKELPALAKITMKWMAKTMTTVVYYF